MPYDVDDVLTVVYPENVEDTIKKYTDNLIEIDALSLAEKAGNSKAVNVILIGAMAKNMPAVDKEVWIKALTESVPPKFLELNLKAFEMGYNIFSSFV